MKKVLLALALVSACSPGEEGQTGTSSGNSSAAAPKSAQPRPAGKAEAIETLTGFYEGGQADRRDQMCIVEGRGGSQRFGLVVWGSNMHSCAGSGTATRQGDVLQLEMEGDSTCRIEARIAGNTVRLPDTLPSGCSYYCGANARLAGAELAQTGTGRDDAMKAQDLVGEPLCDREDG